MGKVIVITGAGSGLGRAFARRFARDGDSVVLLGRSRDKIETVASEIGAGALAIPCDVASADSVRQAFARIAEVHPQIDVLINNAAIYDCRPLAEASDEHITSIVTTNLIGPMFCARAAIPLMRRGGQIINISSESVVVPYPFYICYQSSKAGLEEFSARLATELDGDGIRVTVVRAGAMRDEDSVSHSDPDMARRFFEAALAAGIDFRTRPLSHFDSVTEPVRALIDLPADLHAPILSLQGFRA